MSRTVSTPNGGITPNLVKVKCEYGTINTGDTVVLTEVGGAHSYSSLAPYNQYENNNTSGGKTIASGVAMQHSGSTAGNFKYSGWQPAAVLLSNGNTVSIYGGSQSAGSTTIALNFTITTPAGSAISRLILPSTAGVTIPTYGVYALSAGGFAVIYAVSSTLYMQTFTNDGVAVLGQTALLSSTYSAGNYNWQATVMSNGNIAVFYNKSSSAGLSLSIFNTSGTQQGTTISFIATATWYIFGVWQAPNGDVFSVAQDSFDTYIVRATSTGTAVGSPLRISTTSSLWQSQQARLLAVANADNSVTVLSSDTASSGYWGLYFISSTNTLITARTYTNGLFISNAMSSSNIAITTGDGLVQVVAYSSTCAYGTYTSSGVPVTPLAFISGMSCPSQVNFSNDPGSSSMRIVYLGEGLFLAQNSAFDNSSQTFTYASYLNFSAKSAITTSIYTASSQGNTGCRAAVVVKDGTWQIFTNATVDQNPQTHITYMLRSGIYGVSTTTFSNGSSGYVAVTGAYDLPTSQQNGPLISFNNLATTVPANKGVVTQQSVYLNGLV